MEMPLVIDLPVDVPARAAPSVETQVEHGRLDVLVASPSPALRQRVAMHLREGGHSVRQARTPEEVAATLAAEDGPTVALIDQALGSRETAELLRQARACRADRYVYVVLLVEGRGRGAAVAAREAGADDCLAKPVQGRELDAYLSSALRILTLETQLRSAGIASAPRPPRTASPAWPTGWPSARPWSASWPGPSARAARWR
jgi:PleD family two-component response regulator